MWRKVSWQPQWAMSEAILRLGGSLV